MKDTLLGLYEFWGPPAVTIVIGIMAGWIFKRFIHSRIEKITTKTSWKGDDLVFESIQSYILFWFFLGAVYMAVNGLDVSGDYASYSKYVGYIAKIALALLILSITMSIAKVVVGLLDLWSKSKGSSFPSTAIFTNLARITIIMIGVLIILQSFGLSITPILTAFGVGGLAVSLALKDTLSDFFAGLHILLSQKVRIDDFVELDSGQMGYVTNITWRNTSLKERTNNLITIPNSKLSNAITKNYDVIDTSYSVKVTGGVAYDSDLDHVEQVIIEVANSVIKDLDTAKKDHTPAVRFQEFGDSSINFTVYMRAVKYGDHHPVKHEFIKRLHKKFDAEGIEIPFPIRTLVHKNSPE
ncbi:MAG: mechanosensitive ion channel family protein [Candidatus Marinimicrobia bacterium]|jgi:small-conductance mechanosensitive channel|nr:mechanosensitive ion channel family protein [Candidatus Neomarinimicrobiota bacterium]MBT3618362.1 mechanosensitive ion channel family protein [Candidatus Neomarinimicrobiota bacterium]MBT3829157.1 mechanosensitive ion channel family protein [Candidatus Neomarinimicrobiota bacterium]MBT3998125.1 mechanosensitive ion channel family protein [Candidatus Neomarinimicrobiota bacterium]MBT4281466.1 mechanosensitive ion channel family protein [Candidatus Neomarinimicrobiota bacterium]